MPSHDVRGMQKSARVRAGSTCTFAIVNGTPYGRLRPSTLTSGKTDRMALTAPLPYSAPLAFDRNAYYGRPDSDLKSEIFIVRPGER